jgi:hypothetical protein
MSSNHLRSTGEGEGEGGRPLDATLYRHIPGSLLAVLTSGTLGPCVAGVWSNDVPAKTGGPRCRTHVTVAGSATTAASTARALLSLTHV